LGLPFSVIQFNSIEGSHIPIFEADSPYRWFGRLADQRYDKFLQHFGLRNVFGPLFFERFRMIFGAERPMDRDKEVGQQKLVDLKRGLFCVHYKGAEDDASPPKVVVSPAPGDERKVELVLHPEAKEGVLWQPGSSLVLRMTSPAKLQVRVVPMRPNGSCAASVKFETLTQGTPTPVYRTDDVWDFGTDEAGLSGFRLLGHVAGIGDVRVGPNEWIAGPTTPSRIEGIALRWPEKPDDLDLRYAVKSAVQSGAPTMVGLETFAGTRRRALPITGMVLEMSGPGAANCQFQAEALFLSAPILRAVGQRIVLSGPTGREPLVGLRVAIEAPQICTDPGTPMVAIASKTPSQKAKVRVFRGRAKLASPQCCGAKTNAGKPCQVRPLIGRKRCRLHVGEPAFGAQRGNKRARKPGPQAREPISDLRKPSKPAKRHSRR
jgi:hypothetical protein